MQFLTQLPIFLAFAGLISFTLVNRSARRQLQAKSRADWLLDVTGLMVQGLLIPILQSTWILGLYRLLLPNLSGCLVLPPLLAFAIGLVAIDYLYYWNHRLLHNPRLWAIHQVHHTVTHMDVLGTARNTLWSSGFILYLWVHSLWIYLLADPTAYLWSISLTAALDLWRHSAWQLPIDHWLYPWLSPWLILPQDHAQHHASTAPPCNYGANFKLWDRWHRTYNQSQTAPSRLGIELPLNLLQKLLLPFP